jgi:hypothetical protein
MLLATGHRSSVDHYMLSCSTLNTKRLPVWSHGVDRGCPLINRGWLIHYNITIIQKWGRNETTCTTTVECHCNCIENWLGMIKLASCLVEATMSIFVFKSDPGEACCPRLLKCSFMFVLIFCNLFLLQLFRDHCQVLLVSVCYFLWVDFICIRPSGFSWDETWWSCS